MTNADLDELGRHRIAEIRLRRIRTRWPRLLGRNATLPEHGYGAEPFVREIVTDRGSTGWGISRRLPPDEAAKLVGRRLDELFDPAVGVIADEALPLDRALHDLAGVILGVPVYEMLGGAGEAAVGVYSGAVYMDDITPAYAPGGVGVVVGHCRQDYDYGYRAFKLKIGRGHRWMEPEAGLARDIEVTRAVRQQLPDCEMLVDANNGYECGGFVRYFEAVADCCLYTIEEPFHENRDDLRRLRDAIEKHCPTTTVTEGESNADVELLLELASEGLVQLLNLDIGGYGFTAWRRLAPRAIEHGLLLSPHTFNLEFKTCYAAHLLAATGHAALLESIPEEAEGVDTGGYRLEEGVLHVPDAPGFGLRLVWARTYDEHGVDDSGFKLVT